MSQLNPPRIRKLPFLAFLNLLAAGALSGQALSIVTPCPLPSALPGEEYSFTLAASGGVPNYRWTIEADFGLPQGLRLDQNAGTVSGVTRDIGVFGFLLTVTDMTAASVQKRCSLTVQAPGMKSVKLTANQTTLVAQSVAGSRRPLNVVAEVSAVNAETGNPEQIEWRASATLNKGSDWLQVSPSGSTPGLVTIIVDPAGLAPDDYQAEVKIETAEADAPLLLTVVFQVKAPQFLLSSTSFSFRSQEGLAAPGAQTLGVNSNLDEGLDFKVTLGAAEVCRWLEVSASATVTRAAVELRYAANDLGEGVYACPVTLRSSRPDVAPAVVTAVLTQRGPRAVMAWPSQLVFDYQRGFNNPGPQQLLIAGNGFDFQVAAETTNAPWIQVDRTSGRTPQQIQVTVDPSRLTEGSFDGKLTITSPALAAPLNVKVTINISSATRLSITPRSLLAQAQAGSSLIHESVMSVSSTGDAIGFQVEDPPDSWMGASPSRASTGSIEVSSGRILNRPVAVRITATAASLSPGTYRRKIRVLTTAEPEGREVDFTFVVGGNQLVPLIADGGGWQTGIYLANPESAATDFTIRLFGSDGQPIELSTDAGTGSRINGSIPPNGLRLVRTGGKSTKATFGWAEIISTKGTLASVLLGRTGENLVRESAESVRLAGNKGFLLPFDADSNTSLALLNADPSRKTAAVSLTYRGTNGKTLATAKLSVGSRTQVIIPVPVAAGASRGFVNVESADAEVMALAFDAPSGGGVRVCEPPSGAEPFPSLYRVFPRVNGSSSSSSSTLFQVGNSRPEAATLSVQLRTPADYPWSSAGFAGYEGPSEVTVPVAPFGSAWLQTTGSGSGWAEIVSTQPLAGCVVSASEPGGAPAASSGGSPLILAESNSYMFLFDNAESFSTQLTIFNASTFGAIPLSLTLRDERGQRIRSETISLGPRSPQVLALAARFPESAGKRGTIELKSLTTPFMAAVELQPNRGGNRSEPIMIGPLRR